MLPELLLAGALAGADTSYIDKAMRDPGIIAIVDYITLEKLPEKGPYTVTMQSAYRPSGFEGSERHPVVQIGAPLFPIIPGRLGINLWANYRMDKGLSEADVTLDFDAGKFGPFSGVQAGLGYYDLPLSDFGYINNVNAKAVVGSPSASLSEKLEYNWGNGNGWVSHTEAGRSLPGKLDATVGIGCFLHNFDITGFTRLYAKLDREFALGKFTPRVFVGHQHALNDNFESHPHAGVEFNF